MAHQYPTPPRLEAAREQLLASLRAVEKKGVDPLAASWAELEQGVIKLLRGPFHLEQPEHQLIALGLAAIFGDRLARDLGAFWYPNREAPEGAAMGFPEALVMLSPFGAVAESLRMAQLPHLDEVSQEIRSSVGRVKLSAGPVALGQNRLTPLDYQRLFDPGFVQLVSVDSFKARPVFEGTVGQLSREVRSSLARVGQKLPQEAKGQIEGQLTMALGRLDPDRSLLEQISRAPRLPELLVHLFGTVAITGAAPEELWNDLVFPLLHIGAPEQFPPLDEEERSAYQQGADPLLLFAEVVPYQFSAPEEGLFGAIAAGELSLPHPSFEELGSLRFIKLKVDRLRGLLEKFDEEKTRDAVARFSSYLRGMTEKPPAPTGAGTKLLDDAMALIADLKQVVAAKGEVHLRRITEAEATSEGALAVLREVIQGPKLIMV